MKHRALLVGLGRVGQGYDAELNSAGFVLTHARALSLHPAFRLCGGVDPSPEARELFTRRFGAPAFASLADAAGLAPEVAVIATPTERHAADCTETIRWMRPRAILCEKPLAYDLAEARELIDDCADAGTALAVNYVRRCEPGAMEIRRRLRSGEIALPARGVAWYTKGLLHSGSHLVNLLEFWLGPVMRSRMLSGGSVTVHDGEPDLQLWFREGDVTLLAANERHYSHHAIELLAPNGRLRYDAGGASIHWQGVADDANLAGYRRLANAAQTLPNELARVQWHVAEQWARQLAGEDSTLCSGYQALATLAALCPAEVPA